MNSWHSMIALMINWGFFRWSKEGSLSNDTKNCCCPGKRFFRSVEMYLVPNRLSSCSDFFCFFIVLSILIFVWPVVDPLRCTGWDHRSAQGSCFPYAPMTTDSMTEANWWLGLEYLDSRRTYSISTSTGRTPASMEVLLWILWRYYSEKESKTTTKSPATFLRWVLNQTLISRARDITSVWSICISPPISFRAQA